ncbi:GatB/YqeY domain-containing protein [Candidatus Sulfidibacterium hydrothermale]|uniref:GatB/YqeY domain-containing protein n=1 Tax=Candidatus Sulfidibacterium hydrothermale TaxID=2875962 RepID=UPI001F0AC330|nr:GatB/YqeY domain-containing protein [Candidatus Sulfidibacterium hydrothermale]UBM63068.1 GatB/YqeY domain-containing protein [Candidatus Sulfidibacterium hydrothermale]
MGLEHLINQDLKEAMLAKDRRKLEALRAIKAALLLEKTGGGRGDAEIPETVELKLLQKLVKQRRDTAKIYREQNRADLAEEEEYQASIIEKYLPEQMSEEEIQAVVDKVVADTGASSMKEMGKVMGIVSKQLAGKADNKTIALLVKKKLS